MPLDVTASVRIDAPPSAVAAVQFDPARDPDWISGVDRVELQTPPPLALRSQVRRLGRFLGRRIEWVMRVDELEADRHVGMCALRSPFPMKVDYLLEPIEGGQATQATIRIRGNAKGLYGLPGPLLGPMVRRSVTGDLRRLKRIIEADHHREHR
jgi:Polyketide cyclase / dehydrase and lipid transport